MLIPYVLIVYYATIRSMCVVDKQFELLEFVFESVYVDLQYYEIALTFTVGLCACVMFIVLW